MKLILFRRPLEQKKNGVFVFEILPVIREIFKFLLGKLVTLSVVLKEDKSQNIEYLQKC